MFCMLSWTGSHREEEAIGPGLHKPFRGKIARTTACCCSMSCPCTVGLVGPTSIFSLCYISFVITVRACRCQIKLRNKFRRASKRLRPRPFPKCSMATGSAIRLRSAAQVTARPPPLIQAHNRLRVGISPARWHCWRRMRTEASAELSQRASHCSHALNNPLHITPLCNRGAIQVRGGAGQELS